MKNHRIEFPSPLVAKGIKVLKNGKEKVVFNFRFGKEERMNEYVASFIQRVESEEAAEAAHREAKKNFENPFKVGQILYNSWGYDQTNIDFYEIVKVKGKKVVMREVAQEITKYTGHMAEYVVPVPGSYLSTNLIEKIVQYGRGGHIYINSKHGSISLFNGEPKYQSHYA